MRHLWLLPIIMLSFVLTQQCTAQESPYLVTYDHYLEEPGNLEVGYFSTFGTQPGGNNWDAGWMEFEYGAKAWWTTEFYLDEQTTFGDGTLFTGFRWENRFRLLQREHFVNPVLYIEYEQINDADKLIKEVEGHDVARDNAVPNALGRHTLNHELEFKILLSNNFKGWNVAVNPLATKNLVPGGAWEFGYAVGASRPLAQTASPTVCNICRENFTAGVELYGGLGDAHSFGFHSTSHYVAPAVAWNLPSGWTVRLSPGFGLSANSHGLLLRCALSREFAGFGEAMARMLGRRE